MAAARALLGAVARGRGCAFDSAAAAGVRRLRMGYAPPRRARGRPEGPPAARPPFLGAGRRGGFALGRPRIFLGDRRIPLRRRGPGSIWLVALNIALGVPAKKAGS